jgi:transposase
MQHPPVMDASDLNLHGCGLAVTDFVLTPTLAAIVVASTSSMAACPRCGGRSDRVHSRYTRTIADLACHGRSVMLRLRVRRFRCTTPSCPRAIFCERLPELVASHARTTERLTEVHRLVGLALGGEPGARLADHLAIPTSADTLLRRVKDTTDQPIPAPRFVGIDDWAWRKGRRYGTIVVDLERGRVIDLLPDREEPTVKAWLAAHPGVELVSRDRYSAYAQAATEAAPQARQVADRWHLLKNLREAIERLLEREHAAIDTALKSAGTASGWAAPPTPTTDTEATPAAGPSHSHPSDDPAPGTARQQAHRARRRRRVERFERVGTLRRAGHSVRRIAHEAGLSPTTVRKYLRSAECPDWGPGRVEPSRLDAHREWIDGRIAEGCTNAAALHRELVAQGCRVSPAVVRRYVTKRLAAVGEVRARVNAARPPAPPLPSPKQLSFDWVRRRADRADDQQARLDAIRGRSAELSTALDLADEFAALIRKQSPGTLADWLARVEASACPELRRFAEGIRRDEAAVREAVTGPWSNGPVEGHVNRLKLIKRQMYGRAGFKLLRARVIHAA